MCALVACCLAARHRKRSPARHRKRTRTPGEPEHDDAGLRAARPCRGRHAARPEAHDRGRGDARRRRRLGRARRAARGRRALRRGVEPGRGGSAAPARGARGRRPPRSGPRRAGEPLGGPGAGRAPRGARRAGSWRCRRSPGSADWRTSASRRGARSRRRRPSSRPPRRRWRPPAPPSPACASPGDAEGGRFALTAPLGGVVLERSLVQGRWSKPARTLFKIGDLSTLWLVAHASERDAVRVAVGVDGARHDPGAARASPSRRA